MIFDSSSCVLRISSPRSLDAALIAASSASTSRAGSPIGARATAFRDNATTSPAANPGEARRPFIRRLPTRVLHRHLVLLIEASLDELDDRGNGRSCLGAARAAITPRSPRA